MDLRDSPQEAAFRQEVREFIERECSADVRRGRSGGALFGGGSGRFSREGYWQMLGGWLKKLADRGWVAPAWPTEYGGGGLSVVEQFILSEEMATAGAPRSPNQIALGWVGPTMILYGTDEQKKKHLPPILKNEMFWCQGFSEPGAGSDLDVRRTGRALDDPARADRSRSAQAQGDQLLPARYEVARHYGEAAGEHGQQYGLQ